ncbi:MAG: hypothetical protein UEY44_01130 [Coprococcus sp.]|nr:hypothetical protein [Coprococcus sp.]
MAKNKKKNKNNEEIYDDLPDKDINDDTSYDDTDYDGEVYDDETAYDDEADYDDDVEYPDDGEYSEDGEYEDGEEYSEDGQYEDGGEYSEDGEYEDGGEYSEDGEYEDGEEYSEDGQYEEDDQYDSDEAYVDDYQDNTDYKNNKQYIDDAFGDMWDERPEKKEYNGPKKPSVAPLVTCWILFAVLCVAYVYFFFIKDTSKDKGNTGNTAVVQDTEQTGSEAASTEEVSADDVGKDNSVELDIPENASYKKCDDTAITDVINAFLTAKVNCDQDGLKSCVLETENYDDMSKVNSAAEFIKEYKNVTCYVADGYDDNGKVVFVLSNLVIADVDSNPLNIESFYVAKQSDGTYKINENRSTGIESYINNVIAKSDIQKIYAHVSDNVQYLYNNDPAFKDFYDKIHPTDTDNTGDGSSEEATSEDDSSSEADTQEGTEASTESAQ